MKNKSKMDKVLGSAKESHLDDSGVKEGQASDRIRCQKCNKQLPLGDYGQKDKFGNRFCNLKCLKAFHGIPEVHD